MSLTKGEAHEATEAVKQAERDREDQLALDRDESLRLVVNMVLQDTIKDVDALIRETVERGEYHVYWTIDESDVNWELRAKLSEHYGVLGYSVVYDKKTTAAGTVDRLSLYLDWR